MTVMENISLENEPVGAEEMEGGTEAKVKVFLAEDHNIVRNGIRSLLEKEPGIEVVGEASDGQDALAKIEGGLPIDVVLAEMNMAKLSGVDLVTQLKRSRPGIKVLILSMLDHDSYVLQALGVGAKGYLLKRVRREELVFAIKQVANGNTYVCMELVQKIVSKINNGGEQQSLPSNVSLSKREIEVLALIAEGLTNSEIANKLFTSRRTVEGHRKKLIDKTGARNTAALIKFAVMHGLLQ